MNVELMRQKMQENTSHGVEKLQECELGYLDRLLATLNGARGKCSVINEKISMWIFSILVPYLIGFILITVLCLSLVDISLGSYFTILAENFSIFGLWTIGYFLLSGLFLIYLFATFMIGR